MRNETDIVLHKTGSTLDWHLQSVDGLPLMCRQCVASRTVITMEQKITSALTPLLTALDAVTQTLYTETAIFSLLRRLAPEVPVFVAHAVATSWFSLRALKSWRSCMPGFRHRVVAGRAKCCFGGPLWTLCHPVLNEDHRREQTFKALGAKLAHPHLGVPFFGGAPCGWAWLRSRWFDWWLQQHPGQHSPPLQTTLQSVGGGTTWDVAAAAKPEGQRTRRLGPCQSVRTLAVILELEAAGLADGLEHRLTPPAAPAPWPEVDAKAVNNASETDTTLQMVQHMCHLLRSLKARWAYRLFRGSHGQTIYAGLLAVTQKMSTEELAACRGSLLGLHDVPIRLPPHSRRRWSGDKAVNAETSRRGRAYGVQDMDQPSFEFLARSLEQCGVECFDCPPCDEEIDYIDASGVPDLQHVGANVLPFVYCAPSPSPVGNESSTDSEEDEQDCSGTSASRGSSAAANLSSRKRGSANQSSTTKSNTPPKTPPASTSTSERSDNDVFDDDWVKTAGIIGTYGTIGTQPPSPPGQYPAPTAVSKSSKSSTARAMPTSSEASTPARSPVQTRKRSRESATTVGVTTSATAARKRRRTGPNNALARLVAAAVAAPGAAGPVAPTTATAPAPAMVAAAGGAPNVEASTMAALRLGASDENTATRARVGRAELWPQRLFDVSLHLDPAAGTLQDFEQRPARRPPPLRAHACSAKGLQGMRAGSVGLQGMDERGGSYQCRPGGFHAAYLMLLYRWGDLLSFARGAVQRHGTGQTTSGAVYVAIFEDVKNVAWRPAHSSAMTYSYGFDDEYTVQRRAVAHAFLHESRTGVVAMHISYSTRPCVLYCFPSVVAIRNGTLAAKHGGFLPESTARRTFGVLGDPDTGILSGLKMIGYLRVQVC